MVGRYYEILSDEPAVLVQLVSHRPVHDVR